jgi:hypothetical protein
MINHARLQGWLAHPASPCNNTPLTSVQFSRADRRVWFCVKGWACARLVNGKYTRPLYLEKLADCFKQQ